VSEVDSEVDRVRDSDVVLELDTVNDKDIEDELDSDPECEAENDGDRVVDIVPALDTVKEAVRVAVVERLRVMEATIVSVLVTVSVCEFVEDPVEVKLWVRVIVSVNVAVPGGMIVKESESECEVVKVLVTVMELD